MYPDQNAVRTPKQPDTPVSDAETEQPKVPTLTKEQFASLETNLDALKTTMDKVALEASVYRIKGLVEQIQIHRKNLTDLEKTEAEYGALVPQHIKRAIERESTGIIDKTLELQGLLSSVYQRKLEI
jgi:hypothetical protein